MKVLDPGHKYLLGVLDSSFPPSNDVLTFVKREGPGFPGNVGHYPGTNMQDVIRALIDRVQYVDNQIHDSRNLAVLFHLRQAFNELEDRAASRHGHTYEWSEKPELLPACGVCGHISCLNYKDAHGGK